MMLLPMSPPGGADKWRRGEPERIRLFASTWPLGTMLAKHLLGREPQWNPFALELPAVVLEHSTLELAGAAFPCQDDSRARSLHPFHRLRRVAGSTNFPSHPLVRFRRKATVSGSHDTTHTSRNSRFRRLLERRHTTTFPWSLALATLACRDALPRF